MLTGGSHLWAGRLRVYHRGLRDVVGQYPHRTRAGNIGLKQWLSSAPGKPSPPRPRITKGLNGLRRWSVLVLLVGQEGKTQVVEQAREVIRYLLCMVARQSEVHTSQELRRALQLYCTYSRMWGEETARNMVVTLRRALASKGRHLLLSAVCFSNFNWEQEKISDDRLQESVKDLENVGELCRATVECETCGKRQVIDQKMVDVDYCLCGGSLGYTNDTREYECWRPFIEREHHIVWRRRHPVHDHLFAYKVYGSYDDVSLSSFMETQLSSSYRTEWDDTALQLNILESHHQSNSDLMYWLVRFPHFFANRDYVFKRRFMINTEKREAVIMSEAVECPDVVPEEKGIHRVNEYWSTMVIRARGEMDQPGIEYTLTYFDNPGTSLPQSITNFVAWTGFPNFLKKLHKAALHLQASHEAGNDVYVSLPSVLRYPRHWRKDTEKLPELDVPSDEEVQVLVESGDAVQVKDDNIKTLNDKELVGKTQDEHSTVIAVPVTSGVVDGADTETEGGDETHTPEEPSTTTVPSDYEEIGSCVEGYSDTVEKSMTLSADSSKDAASDKSLHVNIGGKKIFVDLLEAMEVVAPDLERKSLLVRKIEELNEMLKDSEKQSIILQKLQKLRHKLKSFQEEAVMRRERSMRHMEQLSNRDHYHHMNVDDKTLKHLELLFEAMRYVIQADRDMRTGKTLLEAESAVKSTPDEGDNMKNTQTTDSPGQSSTPSHSRKYGDDQPPDDDRPTDPKTSKTKKKSKMRPPPKEPPPPSPTGEEWQGGETGKEAGDMSGEGGNFANELENIAKSADDFDIDKNESRSWFGGVSIPYISAWWETGSRQGDASSECPSDETRLDSNTVSDLDAQTNTVLAQILYVLTLRWIFYSEEDETSTLNQQNGVKNPHSKQEDGEESECPGEPRWYWYPFNGAYRVYAWVFSASGVNA